MSITIVGAGVAGLVAATELSDRGMTVTVIDRHPSPGPHACSWLAGGMLAPWCERADAEEPVLRLGREAIGWWEKRASGVVRGGSLVVAMSRDHGELDRFARRTTGHTAIGSDRLASLEPDLAGRVRRALFFQDEAHLDPRVAMTNLVERLIDRGVAVQYAPSPDNPPAMDGIVVDARGYAARDRLKDLRGVRGEMMLVRCRDLRLSRPVRLLHPRHPIYIVPRDRDRYMIGATQIESESRAAITARSAVELLNAAYALHPAFGEAEILETGADVRPAFADNLPRLRRRGKRYHLNGLFRHGFLLAPACARMLAETLSDPETIPEIMDEDNIERQEA